MAAGSIRRSRWILLAASVGCGGGGHSPEKDARSFAAAVCDAAKACGCASGSWNEQPCAEHHEELFLAVIERGAEVQRGAFEDFLAALERDPCLADPDWASGRADTVELQGDREAGETCSRHPDLASLRVDECGEHLVCFNGVCVDEEMIPTLFPGDACVPEPPDEACGASLYCAFDGTCDARAGDGAQCESTWGCFGPSYCAGAAPGETSTCRPALEIDDPCDPAEFRQCGHDTIDGVKHPRWCEPKAMRCVEGRSLLCDALTDPVNW